MNGDKWKLALAGLTVGLVAVALVKLGNPLNMGFCVACFERDIVGALGLHRTGVVQYMRPEILGLMLGAFLIALIKGEFHARGGSSTLVRFFLGMLMMLGALVFLGCPLRDVLRISGGDFNALVGLVGFIAGAFTGTIFLRLGFDLGSAPVAERQAGGYIMPVFFALLLVLALAGTVFNPEAGGPLFFSKEGPGSMHAPLLISLGAGLLIGIIAQRARLCLSGGFRDFFLIRDTSLLTAYLFIFIGALGLNLYFGFFKPGFTDQPIAHTMHLWNFLGLFLVGECAVLLGGCPLRQLIMSGEGDMDAAAVVLGMMAGAATSHNFMFAASAKGVTPYGQAACLAGILIVTLIGWVYREKITARAGKTEIAA
ncbi:MAG: YedE family putative selenium transporter [Methylocystaceae bacterium]